MEILLSPDPTLREICERVDLEDRSLEKLSKQMAKIMYKNNGCGLAAPQLGVLKRLVVIDVDFEAKKPKPLILLNPEIIELSEEKTHVEEGCLSVPGVSFPIERSARCVVRAFDLAAEEVIYEADGLFSRCLQHEIDHLDGFTLFERLDPIARIDAIRLYDEALARGAKPGDVG